MRTHAPALRLLRTPASAVLTRWVPPCAHPQSSPAASRAGHAVPRAAVRGPPGPHVSPRADGKLFGWGPDRPAHRVARNVGAHFPPARRLSAASSSSTSSNFETLEAVQLREAVQQREQANQCVKSLTAEVVRLASQLRAEKENSGSPSAAAWRSQSHSPPPARRRDGKLPFAAINPVGPNTRERAQGHMAIFAKDGPHESSVRAQLLRQAIRRRRRMHTWSAMQAWKALSRWSELTGRVGNGLAKRHLSRFSAAVLRAWDRYAKQQECLERALGAHMAQQTASAFRVWRQCKRTRGTEAADMSAVMLEPAGRDDPQLFIERANERKQERPRQKRSPARERMKQGHPLSPPIQAAVVEDYVQRMNMLHYLKHVAIKQMHARWRVRRLHVHFRRFAAISAKVSQDNRVRKRNFVIIGARRISSMLRKCLRAMCEQRLRGLRKQRALDADDLRILQAIV